MGLVKPILYQVPAFDALKNYTFEFNVPSGGDRVVKNQLIIQQQEPEKIVYDKIEDTFNWKHTVVAPSGLKNGEYYNAYIKTFNKEGESIQSNPIQFRCFKTPTIEFTNIPESGKIETSTFKFDFTYNQEQNEILDSYIVNLYSANQVLITSSNVIYVKEGDGIPPYEFSYTFTGFDNDAFYFIEVVGTTVNNINFNSEKIEFNVKYRNPPVFTILDLENNCDKGYITIGSNVKIIDAEYSPKPPHFIDVGPDDKEIDISGEGDFVEWSKGYKINGDFLSRVWFRNPNENSRIVQFSNTQGQTIEIDYMTGYKDIESQEKQAYVQVYVTSINDLSYYIFSNYVDILPSTKYYNLQLNRIENIYQVELLKI